MRSRLDIFWAGMVLSCAGSFGYIGLVVGSAWWSQDPERLDWPGVREFPWNLPYIVLLAIAGGLVFGIGGMLWDAFLTKPLERLFNSSRLLRAIVGIGTGFIGTFAALWLVLMILVSLEPILKSYGILWPKGPWPWLLPGVSVVATLSAAWLGVKGWRGELGNSEVVARPTTQDAGGERDFRDLDMDAETSASGTDKRGFPIFIWRETADNRIGFSRPRYCCITETDDDLLFTFFNPSQNVRTTHAMTIGCVVGGGIFLWSILYGMFGGPHKPGDAFAGVIAGFLFGSLAGLMLAPICYAVVTAWRWASGRFKGEGRLYFVPWSELEAFQVVSADETGAERTKQTAPGGHGLIATFANHAPSFPLTANFWNYESIAEQHRLLTTAFIAQRKALLEDWHAKRKKLAEIDGKPAAVLNSTPVSEIPDRL